MKLYDQIFDVVKQFRKLFSPGPVTNADVSGSLTAEIFLIVSLVLSAILLRHVNVLLAGIFTLMVSRCLIRPVPLHFGQGFVMNWYYHKKTGLDMVRFWKEVGKVYPIPIMMCICTLLVGKYVDFYNLKNMLIGIVCYTAVYCGLNWYFVINHEEKDGFVGFLNKK